MSTFPYLDSHRAYSLVYSIYNNVCSLPFLSFGYRPRAFVLSSWQHHTGATIFLSPVAVVSPPYLIHHYMHLQSTPDGADVLVKCISGSIGSYSSGVKWESRVKSFTETSPGLFCIATPYQTSRGIRREKKVPVDRSQLRCVVMTYRYTYRLSALFITMKVGALGVGNSDRNQYHVHVKVPDEVS